MPRNELIRITNELSTTGYVLTTYEDLGLEFNRGFATQLADIVETGTFSTAAAELTKHIEKQKMMMVQDEKALALGRLMVRPVVEALFENSPRALSRWELYAMNRYEVGGSLGGHQDSVGSTVLVATMSGKRLFNIYETPEQNHEAAKIIDSYILSPGSVMILDGRADPCHAVSCIDGPSVSAVFDVPDLLRS